MVFSHLLLSIFSFTHSDVIQFFAANIRDAEIRFLIFSSATNLAEITMKMKISAALAVLLIIIIQSTFLLVNGNPLFKVSINVYFLFINRTYDIEASKVYPIDLILIMM